MEIRSSVFIDIKQWQLNFKVKVKIRSVVIILLLLTTRNYHHNLLLMTSVPGIDVGEGSHVFEHVGGVPALDILHHNGEVLLALKVFLSTNTHSLAISSS